ncbi:MAG: DUF4349 domain-containing protein [Actinobacteria bacterium]|nr:DUF4349 domain-containing protein [Actinomycetota bacterium]MCG2806811.1 DUF4349 domain-containing protein [Coriobacteriia bacterium]
MSVNKKMPRTVIGLSFSVALILAFVALSGCALIAQPAGQRDSGTVGVSQDTVVSSPEQLGSPAKGSASDGYDMSQVAPTPEPTGADAATVPAADRLVVRTVDLRLRVDDVDSAASKVRKATEKRKGMVIDYQVSSDEGVPVYRPYVEGSALTDGSALSGYLTVRIPADQLDSFTEEISALGKVLRQAENEQDVTQQHVDLKARLVNLQATESRLREFFAKAKNVTEMLAIEQELTRVRGDIESMQAQISYLERQAALSTVTIELTGPTPLVEPAGEDWGFATSVRQALRGFIGTINATIVVIGTLAPLLIILALAYFIIRAAVRRSRARRDEQGASDSAGYDDQEDTT